MALDQRLIHISAGGTGHGTSADIAVADQIASETLESNKGRTLCDLPTSDLAAGNDVRASDSGATSKLDSSWPMICVQCADAASSVNIHLVPRSDEYTTELRALQRLRGTALLMKSTGNADEAARCRLARVPIVTPHALRGTHSSLAQHVSVTAHVVAAALGHTSPTTTLAHYTTPSAAKAGPQRAVERVAHGSIAGTISRRFPPLGALSDPTPRNAKAPDFSGALLCEEGESNPHGC
jgi:hypothetical protein